MGFYFGFYLTDSVALLCPSTFVRGAGGERGGGYVFFRGRALYIEGVSTHTQDTHLFFTRVVTALTKDATKDLHSKKGTQGGIIFQNDFLDITDNQVSNNKS